MVDGQRAMMVEQLAHLATMAERSHVQVQVVPASVGVHGGHGGPFIIAEASGGARVVHGDCQLAARISAHPDDVATLERRWARVIGHALSDHWAAGLRRHRGDSPTPQLRPDVCRG